MRGKWTVALCIVSSMWMAGPVSAADPPRISGSQFVVEPAARSNERPTVQQVAEPSSAQRANAPAAPRPASSADRAKYAAREAASPEAQAYEGGNVIVIGASTATVILAVILLVVLL